MQQLSDQVKECTDVVDAMELHGKFMDAFARINSESELVTLHKLIKLLTISGKNAC
jgi:hypothetical protein